VAFYIRRGTDEHTANMAIGRTRADVAYVRRPCATDEHKGVFFVSHVVPTNMCPYIHLVMFYYYVYRVTDE
jgi:hypothetical protein